ncbi:major facilitator superfamily permease [Lentilactobacillus parafarraginis DSM 18390 = JCM 14109]|uniref:Major facilitator superfamily permease n=1 Tax=Lentilactobacillus parafarraginis DSM 18390 = JCM 14109 TaxID=1423786 RepID=A0A0R1YR94_9LACO|nr:major facilitator superfamily permease [Lentilactobacillus parafarraginis DSM 18390 = JCM 14109]
MNEARETPLFYKVFALAGAGMILDAADVYMAGAINSTLIETKFASISQGSYFLSSGFLGLFIGSILAGYIGDFFGRKLSYHFNLLLFGVFTLLSAFAPNMMILIGLRFIAAIGLGAEIVTGYAVVNEFAPIKRRGHWSGMTAIVANTGAPITLLIASFMIPKFGWRSMFITMGILALILWLARRHFPESPAGCLRRGELKRPMPLFKSSPLAGYMRRMR